MTRFAHLIVLAAFLAVSIGAPVSFAGEPAPLNRKTRRTPIPARRKTTARRTRRRAWAESNYVSRERSARCAPLQSTHAPIRLQMSTPFSDVLIGSRVQCTIGLYALYVGPYRRCSFFWHRTTRR